MNKKGKKSFTLAEIILVVATLGIVAVITLSILINRNIEVQNKTKLKKAMATYDKLLSRLSAEGEIKSNEDLADLNDNCGKTSQYFKIAKTDNDDSNDCIFKTTDGVWWDITNIQRPMIYLKKEGINANNKEAVIRYATDPDNRDAFILVGRFDDTTGVLRVDDRAFENAHSETTEYDNGTSTRAKVAKLFGCGITRICSESGAECKETDCHGKNMFDYIGCDENGNNCSAGERYGYDGNGNMTINYYFCDGNANGCTKSQKFKYDDKGNIIAVYWYCDANGDNCEQLDKYEYYDDGNKKMAYYGCDVEEGNDCKEVEKYEYDGEGNNTVVYFGCDDDGDKCKGSARMEYENGNKVIEYACNASGDTCTKSYRWDYDGTTQTALYECDGNGEHCVKQW